MIAIENMIAYKSIVGEDIVGMPRERVSQTLRIIVKANRGAYKIFNAIAGRIRLGRDSNIVSYGIRC